MIRTTQIRTDIRADQTRYVLPENIVGTPTKVEMMIEGKWKHLALVGLVALERMGDAINGFAIEGAFIHVRPVPPEDLTLGLSMWVEYR